MNKYKLGRSFEYRVQKILRKHNFSVTRSAKSGGLADLVAVKYGHVCYVQCKYTKEKQKAYISRQEREALIAEAKKHNIFAVLAYNFRDEGKKKSKIRFKVLYAPSGSLSFLPFEKLFFS
ncbi:MAG: restriction endonuclease [Thermoproteota archaeon]